MSVAENQSGCRAHRGSRLRWLKESAAAMMANTVCPKGRADERLIPLMLLVHAARVRRGRRSDLGRGCALTGTAFVPGFWSPKAVPNAWKQWGVTEKPANYDAAVRERYGLHEAPYPNDGLPMGLRKAPILLKTGVGIDCMLCHAGSIMGTSYVGLGNSTLDVQAIFEELTKADNRSGKMPFTFANVRGTSEAGGFGMYLLGFRNPDLSFRERKDLGLHDDLCEDVPAWWLMKKKKTIYHTGATDSRSVRTLMQFMMHPLNTTKDFEKHEAAFRDMLARTCTSMRAAEVPVRDRQGQGRGRGRQSFTDELLRSATAPTARSGRTRTR